MNFICSAPTALLSSSHSRSYKPTRTCTQHTYACAGAHPLLVCLICVDIDWYVFIVEVKVEGEGTDGWIGARLFKRTEQRGCLPVDNLSASKRSGTEGERCLSITVRSPNWGNPGYGFCWGRGWLHEGGQHGPIRFERGLFLRGIAHSLGQRQRQEMAHLDHAPAQSHTPAKQIFGQIRAALETTGRPRAQTQLAATQADCRIAPRQFVFRLKSCTWTRDKLIAPSL